MGVAAWTAVVSAVVILLAALGIRAVAQGVEGLEQISTLDKRGQETAATVVSTSSVMSTPGQRTPKMTVRFTAADGQVHRIRITGNEPVGTTVRLRYDPHDPTNVATSLTMQRTWAIALTVVGVALVFGPSSLAARLGVQALAQRRCRHE